MAQIKVVGEAWGTDVGRMGIKRKLKIMDSE
jgi:hypothetical protein